MAEGGENERSGLRQFVKSSSKSSKGYGAMTKNTNDTFKKYYVKRGETVQGIALKHGVTTEQIKRANNIWTNDSLFLREYLLIPISTPSLKGKSLPKGSGQSAHMNGESAAAAVAAGHDEPIEIVTRQELSHTFKVPKSASCRSLQPDDDINNVPDVSAKDFLSKFDSSFHQIKSNVQRLESSTEFLQDPALQASSQGRKKKSLYGQRTKSLGFNVDLDSDDPTLEPELHFKSKHKSRKVQSSLEKLQKNNDDLFQL